MEEGRRAYEEQLAICDAQIERYQGLIEAAGSVAMRRVYRGHLSSWRKARAVWVQALARIPAESPAKGGLQTTLPGL